MRVLSAKPYSDDAVPRHWSELWREIEIFSRLDELIAAGWGDVPARLIPHNWQEVEPPKHWFAQGRRDAA